MLQIDQVILDFAKAKTDGAIRYDTVCVDQVMCTVINESSRTALECALRCDCSINKTVKF